MRKQLFTAAAVTLTLGLAGCSAPAEPATNGQEAPAQTQEEAAPQPEDLTGEWTESDPADQYQMATITADTIEVYWVSDGGDTKSLYWAGTFVPPTETGGYTWTSQNDTSKTDGAMLASSAETKDFTFSGDEISYEVTALGTTKTVRLTR